ncbi:uncharacterized protein LOC121736617 isoform X3 [Aricia agestis]|nr:uncharacterized protein LOC121736617 isoform X3 [Aricia agestis]
MSTRRASYVPNSVNTVTPAKQTAPTKAHNTPAKHTASTKVEYECPRCFLSFNSHLIAVQHIQKFHYGDKKVPNNVQPERKEWCWKCKKKVGSLPIHVCGTDKVEDPNVIYCCLGCNKRLSNLRLFYSHVVSSHAVSLETLFFPTNKELSRWVQDVEYKTNARYSDFVKIDNKCYAHCMQATKKNMAIINICPSIIMIQEFPKGLQVHHYGHHKQHTFKYYKLTDKFKKYSITSFLKVSDSYFQLKDLKSDDNDLYLQFKQLMESVVVDAAKLKSEALTVLFGKALEMTSLLTQYDNDDDMSDDSTKPENQSMTASDIEKALQEPSILDNMSIEPHIKKMKTNSEAPAPMILNSFSLADTAEDATKENSATDNMVKSNIKVKDLYSLQEPKLLNKNKETPKAKILDSTPSSFSESFEVFVEKNFSGGEKGGDQPIRRSVRSTRPARNRIEEHKPTLLQNVNPDTPQNNNSKSLLRQYVRRNNTQNSLKPDVPVKHAPTPMVKIHSLPTVEIKQKTNSDTVDVLEKVKSSSNVSIGVNKTPKTKTDNKSIPDDSRQPVLDRPKPVLDRPKTVATLKRRREIKPKKDIKYEVKEREDDCNILILKI